MTLKDFCSVYGGLTMILYIPKEYMLSIDSQKTYKTAIEKYGNYRVTYFDIYGCKDTTYILNVTIEK